LASPTPILESEHGWPTRVLIFTQLFVRPFRYAKSVRFEAMPSNPILQAA
jgi:hypothetical protein